MAEMKLSLFFELTTDDPNEPGAVERRFEEAIEQCQLAEELGYHGVWCVEHHFLPGYSHMSSPEIFLAAVSQRTSRLRLGTAIMHLPYNINNPIRVAERLATLDILSKGRIEFGGGRATSMEEFEGFSVDPAVTKAQWAEALEIIPEMWTQEYFEYESEFITIPRRRITPKPVQKPGPPMWVACTQPATVEFAGEHGLGVLGFGVSDEAAGDLVQSYRNALKRAKPAIPGVINDRFAVMRMALCLPTDDEAIRLQEYSYQLFQEQVGNLFAPWIDGTPPPSYEFIVEHFKKLKAHSDSLTLTQLTELDETLVGSPETCARALNKMADAGCDEILLFMQGARTPHEKILESIRLFATEVKPRLREPAGATA
jgi:alkanesulfonate monooxygenase SsuD/methylene tetrahydromethanopterin reductase-like flavin-dependent oxidoreductase (luciferase family)